MDCSIKFAKHFVDRANSKTNPCGDMDLMKVMSMVYIAHGWMMGVYGKPLVSEDVEARKHGPVIPELWRDLKGFGREHIPSLSNDYELRLNNDEEDIIGQVYANYREFTTGQLLMITRGKGTPWRRTVNALGFGPGKVIPNGWVCSHYSKLMRKKKEEDGE